MRNGCGMKTSSVLGLVVWVSAGFALTGCGKADAPKAASTAVASAPAAAKPMHSETEAKPVPVPASATTPAMAAPVSLPDLKSASSAQLVATSGQALTNLAALAGPAQPEVTQQVRAVQSSLTANDAVGALAQLKQLAASAQAIPGAPIVIETTKQLVSAWALKQGFDPAKIAPVLGALQTGDYAGLASQAAVLLGHGGLTAEQKTLINSVLSTYGIDAKADALMGKVKGLLN